MWPGHDDRDVKCRGVQTSRFSGRLTVHTRYQYVAAIFHLTCACQLLLRAVFSAEIEILKVPTSGDTGKVTLSSAHLKVWGVMSHRAWFGAKPQSKTNYVFSVSQNYCVMFLLVFGVRSFIPFLATSSNC